jgi:outer membrane protein assembly factor BamB
MTVAIMKHLPALCAMLLLAAACSSSKPTAVASDRPSIPAGSSTASAAPSGGTADWTSPKVSSLIAVDAATGRKLWETRAPTLSVSVGNIVDGTAIISGTDDCNDPHVTVAAVEAGTGHITWQKTVAQQNVCSYASMPRASLVGTTVVTGGDASGELQGADCAAGTGSHPPLVGLDAATGSTKWTAPPRVTGTFATTDHAIVGGEPGGCLFGLDPATGSIIWTGKPLAGAFAASASSQVLVMLDRQSPTTPGLDAFDPASGWPLWHATLPPSGGIGPASIGDSVDVTLSGSTLTPSTLSPADPSYQSPSTSVLIAYEPRTGRVLWRYQSEDNLHASTSVGPGLLLAVWSSESIRPYVEARNPTTGKVLWTVKDLKDLAYNAYTDGKTVTVLTDHGITALEARDGKPMWSAKGMFGNPIFDGGSIYLPVPHQPKNAPTGD